jgi:HEAT repeat protein
MARKTKTLMRNRSALGALHDHFDQQQIAPLAQVLLDPDAAFRQMMLKHVQQTCMPQAWPMRQLLDRLGCGNDDSRPQSMASLVQLGHKALPALTNEFALTRNAALQQAIIQGLLQIAPRLDQDQRCEFMTEMIALGRFGTDESVELGFRKLEAVLRRANESASENSRGS